MKYESFYAHGIVQEGLSKISSIPRRVQAEEGDKDR